MANEPAAYMELHRRLTTVRKIKMEEVECLVHKQIDPTQKMLSIAMEALTRAHEMLEAGNMDIFQAEVDLACDSCSAILDDIETQKEHQLSREAQPMG